MTAEFSNSYMCPGFYPIAARDLGHAALLFGTWKARRKFGPPASCGEVVLEEEIKGGAKFQVRLMGQKEVPEETYRFTVMIEGS